MQVKIQVSVITYPNNKEPIARVRKAVLEGNGSRPTIRKWALSRAGKWIRVMPGEMWPDNAKLEVMIGQAAPEEDDD